MRDKINFHISPRIMQAIANLYDDVNRIFLEYIDNSFDSAEEYFNESDNTYIRPIEIILGIQGSDYRRGKVYIYDNCTGIENLPKVVENVGNSDKKAQPWTNGEFGYGIYSFMACCSKLEVTSKVQDDFARYIPIDKSQFHTDRQEDVIFPLPEAKGYLLSKPEKSLLAPRQCVNGNTGTKIVLSGFERNTWRDLDIQKLKDEIEKHFELLLARTNLSVRLVFGRTTRTCMPFDYSKFEGEVYEDKLTELVQVDRDSQKNKLRPSVPIRIFIKVTKGKEINKRPVFIAKGRRIYAIKETRSFRSRYRSELWDHPNVTGYIDVADFLEPVISRTDFKRNRQRKALYGKLFELELLILDVVKEVNRRSEESHYRQLESRLNQALSALARLDAMNFRKQYASGEEINLDGGGAGTGLEPGYGKKDRTGHEKGSGHIYTDGPNEGNGLGIGNIPGAEPGGDTSGTKPSNKEAANPFEDSEFKGKERKRSGFNVRLVDRDPDIDEATDKPLRSQIHSGEIHIFRKHPDFEDRVGVPRRGKRKITERLISYLAGEITVHYKHEFHNKMGQPEYGKFMFVDLVDFIYQFESMLRDLAGKNLSDLSE